MPPPIFTCLSSPMGWLQFFIFVSPWLSSGSFEALNGNGSPTWASFTDKPVVLVVVLRARLLSTNRPTDRGRRRPRGRSGNSACSHYRHRRRASSSIAFLTSRPRAMTTTSTMRKFPRLPVIVLVVVVVLGLGSRRFTGLRQYGED